MACTIYNDNLKPLSDQKCSNSKNTQVTINKIFLKSKHGFLILFWSLISQSLKKSMVVNQTCQSINGEPLESTLISLWVYPLECMYCSVSIICTARVPIKLSDKGFRPFWNVLSRSTPSLENYILLTKILFISSGSGWM